MAYALFGSGQVVRGPCDSVGHFLKPKASDFLLSVTLLVFDDGPFWPRPKGQLKRTASNDITTAWECNTYAEAGRREESQQAAVTVNRISLSPHRVELQQHQPKPLCNSHLRLTQVASSFQSSGLLSQRSREGQCPDLPGRDGPCQSRRAWAGSSWQILPPY